MTGTADSGTADAGIRRMISRPGAPFRLLVLAVVGLAGGILIGSLMPFGPGLRDDSYTYLNSAQMLETRGTYSRLTGEGDLRPVTNFPPGYPLALALLNRMGAGPQAANLLNQILFGLLLMLIGVPLWLATGTVWAPLAGILLAGLSVDLVTQFTWTQSEPLFLVLVELGVLCLFLFMSNRARRLPAVLAGVAFGMALLTRYAGLGVVSGAVAVVLLDSRLSLRRRLADSLIVVGCSIGPFLLFLLRNLIVAGDVVNRPHGRRRRRRVLLAVVSLWFLVPLLASVFLRIPLYSNFRHVVFALPPVFLVAGLGIELIWHRVRSRIVRVGLVPAILAPGLAGIVRLRPYEYIYYNAFIGGVARAEGLYVHDYWCTSYREAMGHINAAAPLGARVAIAEPFDVAAPFARPDLDLVRSGTDPRASFILRCNNKDDFTSNNLQEFPGAIAVSRLGVPLSAILRQATTAEGPP